MPPSSPGAVFRISETVISVASALLPSAALQSEIAEQDRREQEGYHGDCDRRAFAELAARDCALEGKRRHEMCRIYRPTARQHVDKLEVGEGEQHGEGHGDGDDGGEQWQRHV